MTALLVILGWLVVGTAFARLMYLTDLHVRLRIATPYEREDPFFLTVSVILWPLVFALLVLVGVFRCTYQLVTMPTYRQRKQWRQEMAHQLEREQKLQREQEAREAEALARKLGLPIVETGKEA